MTKPKTPSTKRIYEFEVRRLGKSYKVWMEFINACKRNESAVYAMIEGNILSPKALEQKLCEHRKNIIKELSSK